MLDKVMMTEMTSPEFAAAVKSEDTVIIPVGSTEVLGTHGPLGADFFVASELAVRIGKQAQCLVAPVIPVGDTRELYAWPGTINIGFDTLKALYLDICTSLIDHGLKRLFFLTTHGMNTQAVDHCGRVLRQQGIPVAQAEWWKLAFSVADDLVESTLSPKGHGGEVITSVIMALKPELVDLSRATKEELKGSAAFFLDHLATGGGPFSTYPNFVDLCESGGWGDPSAASPEKGALIIDRAVDKIVSFLRKFKTHPLPRPVSPPAEGIK